MRVEDIPTGKGIECTGRERSMHVLKGGRGSVCFEKNLAERKEPGSITVIRNKRFEVSTSWIRTQHSN